MSQGTWVTHTSRPPKRKSSEAEKVLLATIKKAAALKSRHRAACEEVASLMASITDRPFLWSLCDELKPINKFVYEGIGSISLSDLQQAIDRIKQS